MEVIHILECITAEFNIYREKQKILEIQGNLLLIKIQRIEADRHGKTLDKVTDFVKHNEVNEEVLSSYSTKEESALCVALKNIHHNKLIKETQNLNLALARQQDSAGKIMTLLDYIKDIFVNYKKQLSNNNTNDTTILPSNPEDSDMSSHHH